MRPLAVIKLIQPFVKCFAVLLAVHFQNAVRFARLTKTFHMVNNRVIILHDWLTHRDILFGYKFFFFRWHDKTPFENIIAEMFDTSHFYFICVCVKCSLHNRSPPDFLQHIPTYLKPSRFTTFCGAKRYLTWHM